MRWADLARMRNKASASARCRQRHYCRSRNRLCPSLRTARERGLSLIELIMFIVIVGVAVGGVLVCDELCPRVQARTR